MTEIESQIAQKYGALSGLMNEQLRRLWAAAEAQALGYGGVSAVSRAVGLTRPTITAGLRELGEVRAPEVAPAQRVRRAGSGRPRAAATNPHLLPALEALVEPTSRGDPMSP